MTVLSAAAADLPSSVTASESVVDPAAMTFPNGAFGTSINGQTFQQEALITSMGYQYAAYFGDSGKVCVARRKLPTGPWQVVRFDDYTMRDHRDAHNVVSMGICEADGTLHLAFDHHCDLLHYRRSVPGLTSRPEDVPWTAQSFGPVQDNLETGKRLPDVTYPQFILAPGGKLQLIYRLGFSGNGDWYFIEYDHARQTWSPAGMLLDRKGDYQTSPSRCAYPNPPRYGADGRLHMSWCWREHPTGGPYDLRTNHDLCYIYSDDQGKTWKDNAGKPLCDLSAAGSPIGINTPGIVVRNTRWLWGQMNTTTQSIDPKGRVHVINYQHQQDATEASKDLNTWRYYHYWRDADGAWYTSILPFWGRKPQIIFDSTGNAYVVFCKGEDANYHGDDAGGNLTIMVASEASSWTNWQTLYTSPRRSIGEPLLDHPRWATQRILSIYLQDKPAAPGQPSPLRTYDLSFPGR